MENSAPDQKNLAQIRSSKGGSHQLPTSPSEVVEVDPLRSERSPRDVIVFRILFSCRIYSLFCDLGTFSWRLFGTHARWVLPIQRTQKLNRLSSSLSDFETWPSFAV